MKFEIYDENNNKEEVVILKIEQDGVENGRVIAVDESGVRITQGYLLDFTKDGQIQLCRDVNPNLGFKLDKQGKIMLVD